MEMSVRLALVFSLLGLLERLLAIELAFLIQEVIVPSHV